MNQVSVSIDESNYQNPYELDEILNFIKSVIKKKIDITIIFMN